MYIEVCVEGCCHETNKKVESARMDTRPIMEIIVVEAC